MKDPFISVLFEKLNKVKRDQEVRERLADSLQKFCAYRSHLAKEPPLRCYGVLKLKEQEKKVQRVHWAENIQRGKRKVTSPVEEPKEASRLALNNNYNQNMKKQTQTVVGYCFGRNSVPFITRVRGKSITLAHFKTLFNRKGCYRYFFKKYSKEFGTDIVFEEITDDEQILPLWDGKIFAIVEEMDAYQL